MVSGEFMSRNGSPCRVEFYGAGDGELTIVGVTTSIDTHDRKFVGFKSTTAQIQVLTSEPLVQFYTEDTMGIQVKIYRDNAIVFFGYVTPFAFDQPYTGMDVVTIDCVDAFTAAKDKPYRCVGNDVVDVTIEEVVSDIINHSGLDKENYMMVVHANFDGPNQEDKIFDAKIAQAGFIQDEMTALDAMNAICLFFGYTCVLDGVRLVFFDEHCLLNAPAVYSRNAYSYIPVNGKLVSSKLYDSPDLLPVVDISGSIHNDISVTIERAYDAIQITPSGSDTSVILPDVCADENIEENTDGRGTEPILLTNPDGQLSYSRPIQSKVMELIDGDTDSAWISPAQMTYGEEDFDWRHGAMLVENRTYEEKPYTINAGSDEEVNIRSLYAGNRRNVVWIKAKGVGAYYVGRQIRKCSHTGGVINVSINLSYANKNTISDKEYPLTIRDVESGRLSLIQIKFGDRYWNSDYTTGQEAIFSEELAGKIYVRKGDLMPTAAGDMNLAGKFIVVVPNDSPIGIDIRWNIDSGFAYRLNNSASPGVNGHYGLLITKMEVVGVGDEIPLDDSELRHEYKDYPKDILEVDSPLTTRASNAKFDLKGTMHPFGVNARPAIVPGEYWPCGGYMGRSWQERMPICGILMEQLRERYGKPHPRYSMTCEGIIAPCSTVVFHGGRYTIEGLEVDLVNDTTKITIN